LFARIARKELGVDTVVAEETIAEETIAEETIAEETIAAGKMESILCSYCAERYRQKNGYQFSKNSRS